MTFQTSLVSLIRNSDKTTSYCYYGKLITVNCIKESLHNSCEQEGDGSFVAINIQYLVLHNMYELMTEIFLFPNGSCFHFLACPHILLY